LSFVVWNHLLCSYNIEYVYERMYVYHALVIYLCAYILFIHFYCLINQLRVCVCVWVCIYVFIVAFILAQSRVSVCSLEQSTCYTCDRNRSNRSRNHIHIVLIGKKRILSFSYQYQPSMHKAMVKELFYMFNCVRKPWRARMSKYEYECPSFSESNFFFIFIATRPIRVK